MTNKKNFDPDYIVYTDGGCAFNPGGPGGCAAVILNTKTGERMELSESYQCTTNNRMEIMAVILAVEEIPEKSVVRVYSDSQYVIKTMEGYFRKKKNVDLWQRLDQVCRRKKIESGLLSRTFLRKDIIGEKDFHGAVYYGKMETCDRSYEFIKRVEGCFDYSASAATFEKRKSSGMDDVKRLQQMFGIEDINLIKPGIGESTRVLLRRVPDMVIINEADKNRKDLQPIYRLCKEKQVLIQYGHLEHYKVCGIIKNLADA